MTAKSGSEMNDFFENLRKTDPAFAKYEEKFGPLAGFFTDYEHSRQLQRLTQAEIAKRAGTTQSAVSRFEAMKHPPSYDFLRRVSAALGDRLFLTPFGSLSMSLPYDLHGKAKDVAAKKGVSVEELMRGYVREALQRDSFVVVGRKTIRFQPPEASSQPPSSLEWRTARRQGGEEAAGSALAEQEGLAG
jgi:transcriptional regulator with XRE-family HTH domain